MDILPIIIPPVASYIVSTYCPYTPGFDINNRKETPGQHIIRSNVWPVLSGTIGVAWYLARNKAATVQIKKATKKGTRAAVGKLTKYFDGSHKYTLDFAFIVLIASLNYWIYTSSCQQHFEKSTYVLIGAISALIWVIYLTASYTAYSLLLLTPLLLWLFLSVEGTVKKMYNPTPKMTEAPTGLSDVEKANEELQNEEEEVKEQFRVW